MVPLINLAPPASALYPPVPTAQDAATLADTQSQTNERNAKAAHENEQAAALQRAAAREARDQKSVRDAFLESNGDENKFHEGMLRRGVTPKVIFENVSELAKHHEQLAKTSKEQLDAEGKRAAQHSAEFGALLGLDQETEAPQQYQRQLDKWRADGMKDLPDQYDPTRVKLEATAGMLREKQIESARLQREQDNKDREQANKDAQEGRATELQPAKVREANAKATTEELTAAGKKPLTLYEQAQLDFERDKLNKPAEPVAGRDVPFPPAVAAQRIGIANASRAPQGPATSTLPGLESVPAHLAAPAAAAYSKSGVAYADAKATADEIQSVLDLARSGNKAAGSNLPLLGVGALNAINGIKRMNSAEINQYQGAGSLWDKINGEIGKLSAGQPIPADVLDDIEKLHKKLAEGALRKHTAEVEAINQSHGSTFKPIKLPETAPAPKMIRARDPKGKLHEAPAGTALPAGWKAEP